MPISFYAILDYKVALRNEDESDAHTHQKIIDGGGQIISYWDLNLIEWTLQIDLRASF